MNTLINYLKNMTTACLHNIELLKIVLKWEESRLASLPPGCSSPEFDNALTLAIEDLSMIMGMRDALYEEIESTTDIVMSHHVGRTKEDLPEELSDVAKSLNESEKRLVSEIHTHWSPVIKEAEDLFVHVKELQKKMEERKVSPAFSQVTPSSALLFSYSLRSPLYAFPKK